MAGFNGLKALFSAKAIGRYIEEKVEKADDKAFEILQYMGEEFVNNAKNRGNYRDHTANLRSSIGYIILKDGRIVDYNFKKERSGTDGTTGVSKGYEFANEVSTRYPRGWILIGVAGMEYAAYVEALKSYDVIASSVPTRNDFLDLFGEIEL